jgi:hypothetical protein
MDNLEKLRASPTSFMRAGQQPPSVLSRAATRPLCLFVMGIKAVSGSHAAQTYPRDGFRGMILTPTASRLAVLYAKKPDDPMPRSIDGDAWFDRRDAGKYVVREQTIRTGTDETLVLISDPEMLKDDR